MTLQLITLDDLADDLCRWCKSPLPDTRRIGTVFCGRKCQNGYFNGLDRQARAEARSGLTCQECGSTFDGTRSGQLYCSRQCNHRRASREYARREAAKKRLKARSSVMNESVNSQVTKGKTLGKSML